MVTHPLTTLDTFVSPGVKLHTMVLLALVSAFAVLLSPWLLTVLPLLADRMLADAPNWWGLDFHYNAFLVVPVLCAGVDAVARLARWSRPRPVRTWLGPVWASAVLVIAIWTVHDFAFDSLLHPSSWRRTTDMAAAADVVGRVPSGVTVEAANDLGPALSDRTTVLLWDRRPRWTPWVLADVRRPVFPFCGVVDQQEQVLNLEDHGYRVVYGNDGYLVLHNPGPLPPVDTVKSPGC
jgi:hypothetical protein